MKKDKRVGLAGIFEKNRPQEILTPDFILMPLIKYWGFIALDPAGSNNNLFARKTIFENEDGLKVKWIDKTFVNPPFKVLQDWMEKMEKQIDGKKNIVMLCPVRSHRAWWRRLASKCIIILLSQMSFKGYEQKFPVPMCLLLSGISSKELAKKYQDCLILTSPIGSII